MMLSPLLMLILSIVLYHISVGVNSAGVPYAYFAQKSSISNENNVVLTKTPLEYLSNFDYKIEALSQTINKMDISLQSLQEKSHTWAIFQHHINSWNDGMRVLENKLDLLKHTHEEQHQQIQKLEFSIISHNKINENFEFALDEVKEFLLSERKHQDEILSKITNISKQIQLTTICNERKSNKKANIIAPVGVSSVTSCAGGNSSNKIEQRLNTLTHQMALQKDLKQLNALEKRNSKSLENINHVIRNQWDKYEEITLRLQKSTECCHSVSNELTTFTESSDTLLKRIENLVRDVSERLNDIEVKTNSEEQNDGDNGIANESGEKFSLNSEESTQDDNEIFNESKETESGEKFSSIAGDDEQNGLHHENSGDSIDAIELGNNSTEYSEHDDSEDVEFLRPNLSGCHDLLTEWLDADVNDDSERIDGIYKFSEPDINEIERDFNERYCVFPESTNDTELPWTVIQRRGPYKHQENFNRSWSEYRYGFGHLSRDFWFGNEFIHRLVYNDDYELRIELEDFDGNIMWAEYAVFRIDSEKYNYNLLIGGHRGTVKDAMKYHNDNDFSTYDRRNDKTIDACCSCAMGYASGWWFDNCSEANLNGIYHNTPLGHNYIGIMWEQWHGDYSLKKTRMMIRPHTSSSHNSIEDPKIFHEYTEDP